MTREEREADARAFNEASGFKEGDMVIITDHDGETSEPVEIAGFCSDIRGGIILRNYVFGFRSWNLQGCKRP